MGGTRIPKGCGSGIQKDTKRILKGHLKDTKRIPKRYQKDTTRIRQGYQKDTEWKSRGCDKDTVERGKPGRAVSFAELLLILAPRSPLFLDVLALGFRIEG